VVDDKAEDTETIGDSEFVRVRLSLRILILVSLQEHLVVRVEHSERHLNFIGDIWHPFPFMFLLNFDVEFHVVFNHIVLGVGTALAQVALSALLTFLVVTKVSCSKHARLLEVPVEQLLAELIVAGAFQSTLVKINCLVEHLVTAHIHGARERSSVVRARLIAGDEDELLAG